MAEDEEAFRRWAGERQLALLRTAVLLTGDHHRAEDLVQEALTKVALRWRRLAVGNPEGYARQVIVRDNISWWRKRRHEVVTDRSPQVAVPDPSSASDRRMLLDAALASLTPRQRAVVVLRYYEDRSEAQTAEIMGISAGTVRSQASRALAKLRECYPASADLLEGAQR